MQAELDHFLTRKILLQNSLPLQSHAHCLVRLVSTVRWASVGKKAERGVEGTGQRGGLQSLHKDNTQMRVIGQKTKDLGHITEQKQEANA